MTKDYIYVLLSIGTNIGDRLKSIEESIEYMQEEKILFNILRSHIYESEPVGVKDQPWFLNTVISGYTTLPLYTLIQVCKSLEYLMGRVQRERWHERELDIDILIYGNVLSDKIAITVPHPRMHERRFVLKPASELAGDWVHPVLNKTIYELLEDCQDQSHVKIYLNQ